MLTAESGTRTSMSNMLGKGGKANSCSAMMNVTNMSNSREVVRRDAGRGLAVVSGNGMYRARKPQISGTAMCGCASRNGVNGNGMPSCLSQLLRPTSHADRGLTMDADEKTAIAEAAPDTRVICSLLGPLLDRASSTALRGPERTSVSETKTRGHRIHKAVGVSHRVMRAPKSRTVPISNLSQQ